MWRTLLMLFSGLWAACCRVQVFCAQQRFFDSPWTEDRCVISSDQRLGSRKKSYAVSTI